MLPTHPPKPTDTRKIPAQRQLLSGGVGFCMDAPLWW